MTEREIVLRERAAADKAIEWVFAQARRHYGINGGIEGVDARRYAGENFPLPKITRPRVVRINNKEYRISANGIEFRIPCDGQTWCEHSEWRDCKRWQRSSRTFEEIKALSDLLANPDETVDA